MMWLRLACRYDFVSDRFRERNVEKSVAVYVADLPFIENELCAAETMRPDGDSGPRPHSSFDFTHGD